MGMSELNLNAVDLQSHIGFTYERDDGKVRSWPDHVLTFSHVKCLHSASNLSDHVPLCFNYHLTSSPHWIILPQIYHLVILSRLTGTESL